MNIIKAGQFVLVTTGEYSDHEVNGVFEAKRDIDIDAERQEWLQMHPEQSGDYKFQDDAFLSNLINSGYLLDIKTIELHLSDYRCISEMWVMPL